MGLRPLGSTASEGSTLVPVGVKPHAHLPLQGARVGATMACPSLACGRVSCTVLRHSCLHTDRPAPVCMTLVGRIPGPGLPLTLEETTGVIQLSVISSGSQNHSVRGRARPQPCWGECWRCAPTKKGQWDSVGLCVHSRPGQKGAQSFGEGMQGK